MKQLFYKYAPFVLVVFCLALGLTAFGFDQFTRVPKLMIWVPFVLVEIIVCFLCGILLQRLYHGVHNDELTGLRNRKFFYQRLASEMDRIKRTKAPLSLIFIDVDNFKNVNDTRGHVVGDEILSGLALILKQNSRTVDTVARWGGEEFAVILPETGREGSVCLAERLRSLVQRHQFCCPITISVGVVTTPQEIDVDRFVVLADDALYQAKQTKNQVVCAK